MNIKKAKSLLQKGYSLLQQNDLVKATHTFEKANKAYPRSFDIWFALGNVYSQLGQAEKAVKALRKATEISPERYEAHGQLGVVYYNQRQLEAARSCYQRVIELSPVNMAAHANLAIALIDLGRRKEAVDCCLAAIRKQPGFTTAHVLLGSAYNSLGEFEMSLTSYQQAISLEPGNLQAIAGKADVLIKLGRKAEANELLHANKGVDKMDPTFLVSYASVCSADEERHEAAAMLEKSLKTPALTDMQKLQLHFSAGKLYDRMQLYDDAFKHYAAGNRLSNRRYDAVADDAFFDRIIDLFDGSLTLQNDPGGAVKTPVFIIGMPRSGTSLIESILGNHTQIYPAGELPDIPKLAASLSGDNDTDEYPESFAQVNDVTLEQLARQYEEHTTSISAQEKYVTDKLPHNFLFLGFITALFPHAKVIHCRRNPIDTCLSNYFQYFSSPLEYPYQLENIAKHYNNYRRLMAHWQKTLNLPILDIDYETLVTDQQGATLEMLSFLDLPMEQGCLEFNSSARVTRTASFEQVTEKIYTRSVERWRNYEKHLGPLIDNLLT